MSTATIVYSPVKGNVVDLKKVSDPVFAQKMMGEGVAIIPEDGLIVAPIAGVVSTVFPTGHAYGIRGNQGEEILIHIGLDTVNLKGQGFDIKVQQQQEVVVGDPLVIVDLELLQAQGFDCITPIIITNTNDYEEIARTEATLIQAGEPLLTLEP